MADYDKIAGRLRVRYTRNYGSERCVALDCRSGWNDSCEWTENILSLEEAHDLRYLLDRMIATAQS